MSDSNPERNTIRQYEEQFTPSSIEDLKFGIEIETVLAFEDTGVDTTAVSSILDLQDRGSLIALLSTEEMTFVDAVGA